MNQDYFPYNYSQQDDSRYRTCRNCPSKFFAKHLNRVFCCNKCADDFHNSLKRDKDYIKRCIMLNEAFLDCLKIPLYRVLTYSLSLLEHRGYKFEYADRKEEVTFLNSNEIGIIHHIGPYTIKYMGNDELLIQRTL